MELYDCKQHMHETNVIKCRKTRLSLCWMTCANDAQQSSTSSGKKFTELWNYIDSRHCLPLSYLRPAYILGFKTASDDWILKEREQSSGLVSDGVHCSFCAFTFYHG